MSGVRQPPPPQTRRGVHTRLGVPHEADIEVDPALDRVFGIRTHVCQVCNEYCTDATVQFLNVGEGVTMTDPYSVGDPEEESKKKEKEPPPPPPPA